MISAALKGALKNVEWDEHPVFGLAIPRSCPGVPSEILNPKNTWKDRAAYDQKAADLAKAFILNFKQYSKYANNEILKAEPKVAVHV